jgi:hypothetical protein
MCSFVCRFRFVLFFQYGNEPKQRKRKLFGKRVSRKNGVLEVIVSQQGQKGLRDELKEFEITLRNIVTEWESIAKKRDVNTKSL